MKRLVIVLLFLLTVAFLFGCTQETRENNLDRRLDKWINASFEPIQCPPLNRSLSDTQYKGPMIDTHIHIAPIPDDPRYTSNNEQRPIMGENVRMTDYICMLDFEGTTKAFGFFPVWEPTKEFLTLINKTMTAYPDRFVPFIMPPDHDDRPDGYPTVDAKTLSDMLSVYPGLFSGYGEIGLYARGDHGGPKGAPELPPDAQRLQDIYPIIKQHQLIVYFHLGEGQKEAFEQMLDANPDINFIWHGDQLIRGSGAEQDLSDIDDILSKHPNAYYGIDELYGDVWLIRPEVSKKKFLRHFENKEELLLQDLKTWKAFIERHPNQVLWGTDRGWSSPWSLDPEVALTLNDYVRTFIAGLDPSVQEKFAYKNAEQLLLER